MSLQPTPNEAPPPPRAPMPVSSPAPPPIHLDEVVNPMPINPQSAPSFAPIGEPAGSFDGRDRAEQKIAEQLQQLEVWAGGNEKEAKSDRRTYWMFKIPALLGTLATTTLEALGWGKWAIATSLVAAVCIGVDTLRPRDRLYAAHYTAFSELRRLQYKVKSRWDRIHLLYAEVDNPERVKAVARLLEEIEDESVRISNYLAAAEGTLGSGEKQPIGKS